MDGGEEISGGLVIACGDGAELFDLVQDLYTTSKDNQNFLHTRFGLGYDVLKPYKTIIERWLWPGVYKHQEYSVAKAKKPNL